MHEKIEERSGRWARDHDALQTLRASPPLKLEQALSWPRATLTIPVATVSGAKPLVS